MNAQCPKCGSGLRPHYGNSFACGSILYVDGLLKGTFREGMRCTSLQLARAKSRVAELEARCKRLEEAGDAMADWNMNERNLGCDPELAHKWQQAKEAKP